MSKSLQEIYSGWLTKSPPTKRIWRGVSARWRRRWFVLHQGELPAQYTLSYFADRNNHKLKGIIDLDQVEQIDVGLKFECKKLKCDHMFAIKTPTRTYYLAAETENEMNSWVENICNICKMRASDDEECAVVEPQQNLVEPTIDSPPISPVSTSPYIPIFECITGKTPILPNQSLNEYNSIHNNVQSSYYRTHKHIDISPTYLNCRSFDLTQSNINSKNVKMGTLRKEPEYCNSLPANMSPLQSPTDSESVFTDEDWTHQSPDSGPAHMRPSSSSAEVDTMRYERKGAPPPRPPKPQHSNSSQSSYLNLQTQTIPRAVKSTHNKSNSVCEDTPAARLTDESYDFPRSIATDISSSLDVRRRHCYNNAAPGQTEAHVFTYDNPSPKASTSGKIFKYGDELTDEPASPASQTSSQFSNLPSPHFHPVNLMPPPHVDRGLKPRRKLSDSVSVTSSNEPNSPRLAPAPSVDRKLKPLNSLTINTGLSNFESDDENNMRKCRAAPSPIPNGRSSENMHGEEQIYHYFGSLDDQRKKLEYLDLDLDSKSGPNVKLRNIAMHDTSPRSPGAITVYKKVDFFKTEAFNITRNNLEEERKKVPFKK